MTRFLKKCSLCISLVIISSFFWSCQRDIYLCIGQSNMAGRATLIPAVMDTLSNVYLFNDQNKFELAVNPLNRYSTIRKDISMQRLGPSYAFAKEMAEKTGHWVGIVVNARGGSSIESWQKGAEDHYYEEALKRVKAAMKHGRLKAVIWHQGEANSAHPQKYQQQLKSFITNLRNDLKMPDLPVVVGQISQWSGWTRHPEGTKPFNEMILTIPSCLPYSACVSSENLRPLKDETDPHFDTNSQLMLGKRYAAAVLKLLNNK